MQSALTFEDNFTSGMVSWEKPGAKKMVPYSMILVLNVSPLIVIKILYAAKCLLNSNGLLHHRNALQVDLTQQRSVQDDMIDRER